MGIVAVGIDLAKNDFAVHGVDESGKAVLIRPSVKRAALLELVTKLPPWTTLLLCNHRLENQVSTCPWDRVKTNFSFFGETKKSESPAAAIERHRDIAT